MSKNKKILLLSSADNVAVALADIPIGEALPGFDYRTLDFIPAGHKVSVAEIKNGENIVKYGHPIGRATKEISKGRHVHTHNIKTTLDGIISYSYKPARPEQEGIDSLSEHETKAKKRHFMGYVRENGEVGVRNEIWIIPTVGCVNQVAVKIAQLAEANLTKADIAGIHAFTHPHGCSQVGDDHLNTQKILAGLVNNPNAGGVLVLGLGCENNNIDAFKQQIGAYIPERVKFLNIQDSNDEIEEGTLMIYELMEYACRFKRQKVPAGKLIVGLNCGGSDGFSGITANPLVGRFSDALVGFGGIPIMTEVPEMFGAETILMNRCADESIFQKTVDMINGFKEHYIRHGQTVYENPSPGNKQGGISTLEEKSLGCIQKGGETEVTAIIGYGQKAADSGLNLLNGPGNDIVANTLLAASGAQIIIFTTGRGTPVGAPVPTIKVSSNTALFDKKNNWMDFDAGVLLTESTLDKLSDELISYVLAVASGEAQTKNEINGYREIAIFKDGATL